MKFLTADLDKISWVRHGFFTRIGGISSGVYSSLNCGFRADDKDSNVMENRRRVAAVFDVPVEKLLIAKQTHSATTITATAPWDAMMPPEGDAIVTAEAGLALGVLTADCAPVLLADTQNKIIGAAHAGWCGAHGGVLESALAAMEKLGAQVDHIHAAIGPCIGPRSYEVGAEFYDRFMTEEAENKKFFTPSQRASHYIFNLPGYATQRLKRAGVRKVYDVCQDTLTGHDIFFSNRRAFLKSEKSYGVQASVITIK